MTRPIFLFDLGGVLVDLGEPADAMSLDISNTEFWKIWLSSPTVHEYERGRFSTTQFFEEFSNRVGVADSIDFGERFARWELRMFDDIESVLKQLMQTHRVALLSNTNEAHWRSVEKQTQIFSGFTKLFLSYEMGCLKPSEEIFHRVLDELQCDASDVIFLDDSERNVESARSLGLVSHCVAGEVQVRNIVAELCKIQTNDSA